MRRMRALLALLAAVTVAAAGFVPASALQAAVSAVPKKLGTTNGTVWAVETARQSVFVGGDFTAVRPPGADPGVGEVSRTWLAAFNASTGEIDTSFAPVLADTYTGGDATVWALAVSPDGSKLYVGGDFNRIDGRVVEHVAVFDVATKRLIGQLGSGVNGRVRSISVTADTVFVGGSFTKAGWRARMGAAAFDARTGELLPWAPDVRGSVAGTTRTVLRMEAAPELGRVFLGGTFTSVNGVATQAQMAVDDTSGENVSNWPTDIIPVAGSYVVGMEYADGTLYLSGRDDITSTLTRFEGVKAINASTGGQRWYAQCYGDTFALEALGSSLFVGTHAHDCARIGGWPEKRPRDYVGVYELDKDTGSLRPLIVSTDGDASTPGSRNMTRDFATDGHQLFVGGGWNVINDVLQPNLARFDVGPGSAEPTRPWAQAVASSSGAVVQWRASWDRDDRDLIYHVYRRHETTPIGTVQSPSAFWNRPQLSFVDTELAAGQSAFYKVSVTDGDSVVGSVSSNTVTIPAEPTNYREAVLASGPDIYWPLDEPAGSATVTDASSPPITGSVVGAVRLGEPGSPPGRTGAAIDRSTPGGFIRSNQQQGSPARFSIELWLQSSTTSGRLVGFSNSATGTSTAYDRHLYVDQAGRLVFGVYPDRVETITTPGSVVDGSWHHVVAVQGSDGMELWLDGVRVATGSPTSAQQFSGYWRVGTDNLNGWPSAGSTVFNGRLDEVAVYARALPAAEIRQHWDMGR